MRLCFLVDQLKMFWLLDMMEVYKIQKKHNYVDYVDLGIVYCRELYNRHYA